MKEMTESIDISTNLWNGIVVEAKRRWSHRDVGRKLFSASNHLLNT